MTLFDYMKQFPEGEEITVFDNIYDIEVYFYNEICDDWDKSIQDLAKKLVVENISQNGVIVKFSELISNNMENLKQNNLFIKNDLDSIMNDMESIIAGNVSEQWITKFVYCLE